MIDDRFSAKAFEAYGLNSEGAGELACQLAEEVNQELHKVILPKLMEIIDTMNAMGHNLRLYEEPKPGDISFRDDSEGAFGYECRLRIALDCVVSTGYAHLVDSVQEEN